MGKGTGVILLIIGLAIIYFGVQASPAIIGTYTGGPNYTLIIGIVFAVVGLAMIIFSRPKPPRLFR